VGDIITFRSPTDGKLMSHRVAAVEEGNSYQFRTKGDANEDVDPYLIPSENVVGRVCFNVAHVGRAVEYLKTPIGFILLGLVGIALIVAEVSTMLDIRWRRPPKLIPRRSRGKGSGMQAKFWPIAVVTLCLLLLAGAIGQVAGSFTDSETSVGNSFEAWTSTLWLQTTQADFEAGIPSQADTRSSPGDVGLARANRIFAFQGGSANFWAYGVPANSWTSATTAPNTVGAGGALAYDGVQYIYAFRGANSRTFWRYDITNNTWLARANTPAGGAGWCGWRLGLRWFAVCLCLPGQRLNDLLAL